MASWTESTEWRRQPLVFQVMTQELHTSGLSLLWLHILFEILGEKNPMGTSCSHLLRKVFIKIHCMRRLTIAISVARHGGARHGGAPPPCVDDISCEDVRQCCLWVQMVSDKISPLCLCAVFSLCPPSKRRRKAKFCSFEVTCFSWLKK